MSEASELRKAQVRNYYEYHPARVSVQVAGGDSFPGLFDYSFGNGLKDGGNIEGQKRRPKISFYYEFSELLEPRKTEVLIAGKSFTIFQLEIDENKYEGEAWLV